MVLLNQYSEQQADDELNAVHRQLIKYIIQYQKKSDFYVRNALLERPFWLVSFL